MKIYNFTSVYTESIGTDYNYWYKYSIIDKCWLATIRLDNETQKYEAWTRMGGWHRRIFGVDYKYKFSTFKKANNYIIRELNREGNYIIPPHLEILL
jgi:hypothetical protein